MLLHLPRDAAMFLALDNSQTLTCRATTANTACFSLRTAY